MCTLRFYTRSLYFIVCLNLSIYIYSQPISFSYYTIDQGLSQNMVDCIMKDSRGFIWIGTWNGLNRFDGYDFVIYKENPNDSISIHDNEIHTLCEDRYGNIWIGGRKGLGVYHFENDRFSKIEMDKAPLLDTIINVVLSDRNGNIWVGTVGGLEIIIPQKTLSECRKADNINGLSKNDWKNIIALHEDSDGNIWIGTDVGLFKYSITENTINSVISGAGSPNDLFQNGISAIQADDKGMLWVGLENIGLVRIRLNNPDTQLSFYNNDPDNPKSLIHSSVRSISMDVNGNIIVGTLGGLSVYNRNEDNFTNYTKQLNKLFCLNNNFVNCVYADMDGDVWIGTERGGVNKYNVFQKKFESMMYEPGNANSLNNNTINSLYEDNKYIWIGTAGGGLNRYDKKTGEFIFITHDPHNSKSLTNDFISALTQDKRGNLIVGTWGGGLHILEKVRNGNGEFIIYYDRPSELTNVFISSFALDTLGRLWIGSVGGIDVFEPQTREINQINNSGIIPPVSDVGCLTFDKYGNLWIGTVHGLYRLEAEDNGIINIDNPIFKYFHNDPQNLQSLSDNFVISILRDRNNNLWFGTFGNGLNKLVGFDENENPAFKTYNESNGLTNNTIYGIQEDNQGYLWMSTDNGLIKFNPDNESVRTYYKSDGLLNNQYYWSASYKNKEGKMYFGGMNGLNMFYPGSVRDNEILPRPIITGFKIFNEPVVVGNEYYGRVVLNQAISVTREITLSYKMKEFTIEFSALHYNQPIKNKYRYRLDGYDSEEHGWNEVDSKHRYISYSNLPGGDYTFRLNASNNDGKWGKNEVQLHIKIIPPFWTTNWFKAILALIIVLLFTAFYFIRLQQIRLQKIKLQKLVNQRTREIGEKNVMLEHQAEKLSDTNALLEERQMHIQEQSEELMQQKEQLEMVNKELESLNITKDKFFSIIAHDLKNPFQSITGFSELLRNRYENVSEEKKRKYIEVIYNTSVHTFNLLENLLNWSRSQTNQIRYEPVKLSIGKLIEENISYIQEQAEKKEVKIRTYTNDSLKVMGDRNMLSTVLRNLLYNALKFTASGGLIEIRMEEAEGSIRVLVKDNGVGMDKAKLDSLFALDRHKSSVGTDGETGTGLGLIICKEFVEKHGGDIWVESEKGKGSCFYFTLPV